jgi:hypothetical protein
MCHRCLPGNDREISPAYPKTFLLRWAACQGQEAVTVQRAIEIPLKISQEFAKTTEWLLTGRSRNLSAAGGGKATGALARFGLARTAMCRSARLGGAMRSKKS